MERESDTRQKKTRKEKRVRWKGMQIRKQMKIKTFKMQFKLTQRNQLNTQWFDRNGRRFDCLTIHQTDQTQIFFGGGFVIVDFEPDCNIWPSCEIDWLLFFSSFFLALMMKVVFTNETNFHCCSCKPAALDLPLIHQASYTHLQSQVVAQWKRTRTKLQKWNLRQSKWCTDKRWLQFDWRRAGTSKICRVKWKANVNGKQKNKYTHTKQKNKMHFVSAEHWMWKTYVTSDRSRYFTRFTYIIFWHAIL